MIEQDLVRRLATLERKFDGLIKPETVIGGSGQPLDADLTAIGALSGTGIATRTAANTWALRTIVAGTAITVTNGDGVAGNPSIAVSDPELLALAGLTSAADQLPYFTGSGTAALTTLTAFSRTLLDDATAAAWRTTLELVAGGTGDIWVEKAGDTMTGPLLMAAGSISAPSLAFSAEPELGLYRVGANTLGIGTGNSARLTATFKSQSTDKMILGLGTIAPDTGVAIDIVSNTPTIRQEIVRASGGLAFANFQLVGTKDPGTSADLMWMGIFGSATPDPPTITRFGISINPSATPWTDTHFVLTSTGIGLGTIAPTNKLHVLVDDAATNALTTITRLTHNSTGTPAAGFGPRLTFGGESSTTADQDMVDIAGLWTTATHASRTADIVFYAVNNAAALAEVARFTGSGALSVADAPTTRTNLGLAIGTNVQAYDAFLTSIALLGTAADRMIYTTGVDTAAEATITAFARSILDDATEAAFKATVNLEIGTDVQAWDAGLDGVAGLGDGNLGFMVKSGASTVVNRSITVAAGGLTITNGSGVSGNPLIELAGDLQAVESLLTTGIAVRSAADTWVTRTITAGNNIAVTNGSGAAGNPTIAATASGADTNIQYNDGGTNFGGDANLKWNKTGLFLSITGAATMASALGDEGLALIGGNVTATPRFTPAIKFMSNDASFTTENPKLLAAIAGEAGEVYGSDTTGEMRISFFVSPIGPGAATNPVKRAWISHSDSGFGNYAAAYTPGILSVINDQAGTAALALAQLTDTDEEFINFHGTNSAGSLTRSIVNEAAVTTATRVVWVKIHVDDSAGLVGGDCYVPAYTLA